MPSYRLFDDVVVFASSTPSGYTAGTLQNAMDIARTNGRPLYIQQGSYNVGNLTVTTASGGGKPLVMYADPGTVTLTYTTGTVFLRIDAISDCEIRGITFNANSRAYSGAGIAAAISVANASRTAIENCRVLTGLDIGIAMDACGTRQTIGVNGTNEIASSAGRIAGCEISAFESGIFTRDCVATEITGNNVRNCRNNGIQVWQSTPRLDGSRIARNTVTGIDAQGGGSGQNGNGINTYKAHNVVIADNVIRFCDFSAVRCNVSNSVQVLGNNCYALGETAIFIEETDDATGFNNVGNVVSNNVVDQCNVGVSVTNFNNGGRMATVSNNIVRNCHPSPSNPDRTFGSGILAEADAVITGNVVECADLFGIGLGTNDFTRNLIASGNVVRKSTYGISVSGDSAAGHQTVHGNIIQVTTIANGIVAADGAGTVTNTNLQVSNPFARVLVADNQVHNLTTPDPKPEGCAALPNFV